MYGWNVWKISRVQGNRLKQKTTSDVPMNYGCYFRIRVSALLHLLLRGVYSFSTVFYGRIFDSIAIKPNKHTLLTDQKDEASRVKIETKSLKECAIFVYAICIEAFGHLCNSNSLAWAQTT